MEKNKVFDTDLNSLVSGDFAPIEVDAAGDNDYTPGKVDDKPEDKKTDPEEDNLIDLEEEVDTEDEDEESEEEDKDQEEPSSKQSPHKDKSSTSSPLTPYAKLLVDEGILPNLDLTKFDGTAEGLKDAMVTEIVGAVESYKEMLPDRIKHLINNYEEGVPFDRLLELDKSELEISGIDEDKIKNDVSLQKQLIRNYLTKTTKFSEAKINRTIEDYEDRDELKEESLNSFSELKNIINEDKEAEKIKAAKDADNLAKSRKAELEKLEQTIQTADEIIPGMKVSKKTKDIVLQSLTTPVGYDKSGNPVNRIVAKRMEDPMAFEIKLHYLFEVTKGFTDFSKITAKGVKEANVAFEDAIKNLDAERDAEDVSPVTVKAKSFIHGLSKVYNIK